MFVRFHIDIFGVDFKNRFVFYVVNVFIEMRNEIINLFEISAIHSLFYPGRKFCIPIRMLHISEILLINSAGTIHVKPFFSLR